MRLHGLFARGIGECSFAVIHLCIIYMTILGGPRKAICLVKFGCLAIFRRIAKTNLVLRAKVFIREKPSPALF